MELPFENTLLFCPPPIENDFVPVSTPKPEEEFLHDGTFENMTRLLLHMEAELQFKETVIEILLRNSSAQEKLREDIKHLKSDEYTDPLMGLARDQMFDRQTWEESFQGFQGFDPEEDPGFYRERPCYLAVVSGLRAMQVAQTQHSRYMTKSLSLDKLQKQHHKLKSRYSAATKLKDYEIAFSGDTLMFLYRERRMLQQTLEWERKQNQDLKNQIQIVEEKLDTQTKRSTKVINLLLVEIERLSRILIQIEEEQTSEYDEEECEYFSDEESTYFNSHSHSQYAQQSLGQYGTIRPSRHKNYSESYQKLAEPETLDEHKRQPYNYQSYTQGIKNSEKNDISGKRDDLEVKKRTGHFSKLESANSSEQKRIQNQDALSENSQQDNQNCRQSKISKNGHIDIKNSTESSKTFESNQPNSTFESSNVIIEDTNTRKNAIQNTHNSAPSEVSNSGHLDMKILTENSTKTEANQTNLSARERTNIESPNPRRQGAQALRRNDEYTKSLTGNSRKLEANETDSKEPGRTNQNHTEHVQNFSLSLTNTRKYERAHFDSKVNARELENIEQEEPRMILDSKHREPNSFQWNDEPDDDFNTEQEENSEIVIQATLTGSCVSW